MHYLGDWKELAVIGDFMANSTDPVTLMQVMASQDAAGVKRGRPGGDPSLIVLPPIEQYRADYVFLTPDKYAFDFVSIVALPEAKVYLDDVLIGPQQCEITAADGLTEAERGSPVPPYLVYRCQLGFPLIDPLPNPPVTTAGTQNDGVHRLTSDSPIGVVVTGFDAYVTYGYAGGTDLNEIATPE